MENISGKKFNRLTAIRFAGRDSGYRTNWLFLCSCGNKKIISSYAVTHGITKSCGCFNREETAKRTITHGMTRTPIYSKWCGMVKRCTNPNSEKYPVYGGRGIRIEWSSFEDFYKDMYSSYLRHLEKYGKKNTTIERIDNDGNYSKSNCRWATYFEQRRNTSTNHWITYLGEKLCLEDWAKRFRISSKIVSNRINQYGWSIEKALSTPIRQSKVMA